MSTIPLLVVVGITICLLIVPVQASKDEILRQDARKKVLEWLSEDQHFQFSHKLAMREGRIVAEEIIEADEILMVIPGNKILSTDEDDEDEEKGVEGEGTDDNLCVLYEALDFEIGLGEESEIAPYIEQILHEHEIDMLLPSLWSNTAQRLLILVSLTKPNFDIVSLIDNFSYCIDLVKEFRGNPVIDERPATQKDGTHKGVNRVMAMSPEEEMHRLILALALKHQIDEKYMVPLYDQLPHHHLIYNVEHNVLDDDTIQVVAGRMIYSGEVLTRQTKTCMKNCDTRGYSLAIDSFTKYGEVQPYPHLWKLANGVSFIYDGNGPGSNEATMEKSIKWIKPPTREEQLEIMEGELKRQRELYKKEVLLSTDTVDPREWKQIDRYCRSLMGALKDAIKNGYEYLATHPEVSKLSVDDPESYNESEDDSDDEEETCNTEQSDGGLYHGVALPPSKERYPNGLFSLEGTPKELPPLKDSPDEAKDPWLVKGCGTSERCSMVHIAESRGCFSFESNSVRNETEWATMRSAYIATVGPRKASIELAYGSGFGVPIKIGHSPGRGRGVFATADIPKGTLIWRSIFTATFTEGAQYRRFLSVLPDDVVCDLIAWCYTFIDDGDQTLACDLDEASLFNHADHPFEYNIGEIDKGKKQKASGNDIDTVFALRDIEAGEELVTAYDEFHSFGFDELGLM